MTTNAPTSLPAEKVIEIQRRQLDEANWQVTVATAHAETANVRATKAEARVAELELELEQLRTPPAGAAPETPA